MSAIPTTTEACRVGDLVEFRWHSSRTTVETELGVVTRWVGDRVLAMWADRDVLLEQSFELQNGVVDWLAR